MPRFGTFDWACDRIAERLRNSDPALAAERRDAWEVRIVFVEKLDQERFRKLEAATVAGYEDAVADGSREPERYGRFLAEFSALKAIVRMDPRASGTATDAVRVVLDGAPVSTGPRIVVESLLEHPAGFLWDEARVEPGRRLLEARSNVRDGRLDLSDLLRLEDDERLEIGRAVDFWSIRYAHGNGMVAPAFVPLMQAGLDALSEGLQRAGAPAQSPRP